MPKASPMPERCWTLRMDGSKNSSHLKCGRPVAPSPWPIVPPPQRFSTRIGCIQSAIDFREFSPTAAGFLLGPLSPASLMRRVHSASSSPRERRIGTDKPPAEGIVVQIFTAATRGGPMESRDRVTALTNEGLVGDRYAQGATRRRPDYQKF